MDYIFQVVCETFLITYLCVCTEIARYFREGVEHLGNNKLTYLVNCPFCFSFWVALLLLLYDDKLNLARLGFVLFFSNVGIGTLELLYGSVHTNEK